MTRKQRRVKDTEVGSAINGHVASVCLPVTQIFQPGLVILLDFESILPRSKWNFPQNGVGLSKVMLNRSLKQN